jgi:hypothetical protein
VYSCRRTINPEKSLNCPEGRTTRALRPPAAFSASGTTRPHDRPESSGRRRARRRHWRSASRR